MLPIEPGKKVEIPSHLHAALQQHQIGLPRFCVITENMTRIYPQGKGAPPGCGDTVLFTTSRMVAATILDGTLATNPEALASFAQDLLLEIDEVKGFCERNPDFQRESVIHFKKALPPNFCQGQNIDRKPYLFAQFMPKGTKNLRIGHGICVGKTVLLVGEMKLTAELPNPRTFREFIGAPA